MTANTQPSKHQQYVDATVHVQKQATRENLTDSNSNLANKMNLRQALQHDTGDGGAVDLGAGSDGFFFGNLAYDGVLKVDMGDGTLDTSVGQETYSDSTYDDVAVSNNFLRDLDFVKLAKALSFYEFSRVDDGGDEWLQIVDTSVEGAYRTVLVKNFEVLCVNSVTYKLNDFGGDLDALADKLNGVTPPNENKFHKEANSISLAMTLDWLEKSISGEDANLPEIAQFTKELRSGDYSLTLKNGDDFFTVYDRNHDLDSAIVVNLGGGSDTVVLERTIEDYDFQFGRNSSDAGGLKKVNVTDSYGQTVKIAQVERFVFMNKTDDGDFVDNIFTAQELKAAVTARFNKKLKIKDSREAVSIFDTDEDGSFAIGGSRGRLSDGAEAVVGVVGTRIGETNANSEGEIGEFLDAILDYNDNQTGFDDGDTIHFGDDVSLNVHGDTVAVFITNQIEGNGGEIQNHTDELILHGSHVTEWINDNPDWMDVF